MSGRTIERIETLVDALAATLFAAAVGFAVERLLRGTPGTLQLELATPAAALVCSYLLCLRGLRSIAAAPPAFALAHFAVAALQVGDLDELILSDADRLEPHSADGADQEPLLLDNVLAQVGRDSSVVRLFDPSAMPTPGQLTWRIDRRQGHATTPRQDASQALFEALAELRRSLA